MQKPKAVFLITRGSVGHLANVYAPDTREALFRLFDFDPEPVLEEELPRWAGRLEEVEYAFSTWGMPSLGEEAIAAFFPRLKAVFYGAGSVQAFARPFLQRGIRIFSAWGANAVPVAEYAAAQILLANKGYFQGARLFQKDGYPQARAYCETFPGNYGAKVGLLGAGMIGRLVAQLLRQYRLEVLIYDPFIGDDAIASLGGGRASLEEIFSTCQTISNHIANNPQTEGMLDYRYFSRMRPNAAFLNTGRGQQVVEADLARALREEPGRVAVLDVTWPEPPEKESPFYSLPNVILTPHIAGSMGCEVARMGAFMAQEAARLLGGEPCQYEVTPAMLKTMA